MEENRNEALHAVLRCTEEPSAQQKEGFIRFLKKEYKAAEVDLEIVMDETLGSGFILDIGTQQYDWSASGRARQFAAFVDETKKKAYGSDLVSALKESVEDFTLSAEKNEVGYVESAGDGIVRIAGLDHAMYGEVVVFENGVKGMVQDIDDDTIGVILFDSEGTTGEGMRVSATGKQAGIAVGDGYIGRVVGALGDPIDGEGPIETSGYRAVEQPAPGIVDRKSVSVPLETGILAIDAMFPIGRGQRELIIGDRQTGKTSIAVDTILNQKGKDCICIYVAIGQKASTVAGIVHTLQTHGAMDYSIVVAAMASESASLQYIAPYAATSLAEYYMYEGKDVLIVYDDLSKHAAAYRTLSLLLGRSPGREAYPGDVFYLHSRLLERSARLSDEKGGGSITALPVIETQDGDVSAYIPTNVISITDGQIFLESDLFFEGQRPAVNVGLSVSRVGGAAQSKAMKKAAGPLRIELAQYREMEVFTQFSSDLDEATTNQLKQGRVEMELLKQPLEHPLSTAQEVITLIAASARKLMNVAPAKVKAYQGAMLEYFDKYHSDIISSIERSGKLEEGMTERITDAIDAFAKSAKAAEIEKA